jgi:glutamine phosphoribosylpyrophosphate amidotransferase
MVDWIAGDLGVTTLRYQRVDDMVDAIGRPKEDLCLYCWTGRCPRAKRPKMRMDIVDVKEPSAKKMEAKVPL